MLLTRFFYVLTWVFIISSVGLALKVFFRKNKKIADIEFLFALAILISVAIVLIFWVYNYLFTIHGGPYTLPVGY